MKTIIPTAIVLSIIVLYIFINITKVRFRHVELTIESANKP